ncbi:MAG: aldolase/citrate lyase family protein [Candidatus Latescibacterota bacterium]|nr:aldolase/citrate lyase family protein [Candidatus Latescibacterota bacterium]
MPKPRLHSSPAASRYPHGGPGRTLKARLAAGEVLVSGMVAEYCNPTLMKYYEQAGFDFVYFETEHIRFDSAAFLSTVLAARDCGLPPVAKVPQLDRAEVAWLLEYGVVGIQLPRTESRDQLETLLDYLKFPPSGTRAYAAGYGNSDYVTPENKRAWMADQDAESTVVVHIETRAGYESAEEIISTPGVDMVYVGPGDFSVEMGQPGDADHPDVTGPMRAILEICKRHRVPFGTTASSAEAAERWVREGALFFEAADERGLILQSAIELVDSYRRFTR